MNAVDYQYVQGFMGTVDAPIPDDEMAYTAQQLIIAYLPEVLLRMDDEQEAFYDNPDNIIDANLMIKAIGKLADLRGPEYAKNIVAHSLEIAGIEVEDESDPSMDILTFDDLSGRFFKVPKILKAPIRSVGKVAKSASRTAGAGMRAAGPYVAMAAPILDSVAPGMGTALGGAIQTGLQMDAQKVANTEARRAARQDLIYDQSVANEMNTPSPEMENAFQQAQEELERKKLEVQQQLMQGQLMQQQVKGGGINTNTLLLGGAALLAVLLLK